MTLVVNSAYAAYECYLIAFSLFLAQPDVTKKSSLYEKPKSDGIFGMSMLKHPRSAL